MPRRHTKKRRTHKKKMKGGFYSFNGALGSGAPAWSTGSEMGQFAVDKGGNIQYGRGRKRKTRGRKTRRMRGGSKYGGVSAGFGGDGSRGLANYVGSSTRNPTGDAALGAFNDNGGKSGDFSSFNILPK